MRIGLLTDGGYPYAKGESALWCDRLVRGLAQHEYDVYALSRTPRQERAGRLPAAPAVRSVRTMALWTPAEDGPGNGRSYGRRERRRYVGCLAELAAGVCGDGQEHGGADAGNTFAMGLYGLADLLRAHGAPPAALRSEAAVRALEAACRAPGARRGVRQATLRDHLAFSDWLERALRPLVPDWYGPDALGAADLCHAVSGGLAALPGLLAKRFFGVPLLLTEYGVHIRSHYLTTAGAPLSAPLRALLAAFHGRLATEVYRQAAVITHGNAHARRWQQRCGADPVRLRTIHPGLDGHRFAAVGEAGDTGDPYTLVWVGRAEPAKDLVGLLHAFAAVHREEPRARLRIVHAPPSPREPADYLAHCRTTATRLFPTRLFPGTGPMGQGAPVFPVTFEEVGGPSAPDRTGAYADGAVTVLSSVVEGFPAGLVEAMLCGRATVSTDVGAVVEVVGGTGLVVPPRNPQALAAACLALLRDPARRARLGAAARARALELFTVEQNLSAFHGLYLELMSRAPVRRDRDGTAADGTPLPFAHPAEAYLPGRWTGRLDRAPAPVPAGLGPPVGAGATSGTRPHRDTDSGGVGSGDA
ncbi:DUF3492 domain-containing protein [Streptomyces sp. NPDC047097]|uniref:DUF3492 domain-containing protein n=1 Tax=Streptomyces sp. NPDC047097 TaxID=3155260 RepID=UPI00340046CE